MAESGEEINHEIEMGQEDDQEAGEMFGYEKTETTFALVELNLLIVLLSLSSISLSSSEDNCEGRETEIVNKDQESKASISSRLHHRRQDVHDIKLQPRRTQRFISPMFKDCSRR